MGSFNLHITVMSGGTIIGEKDRPVRQLPDGRMGIVFRGRVYPLIDPLSIEINGESLEKAECPVLSEPPADWREQLGRGEVIQSHLDTSGYFTYLMLNGDENLVQLMIERLRQAGVIVEKFGESTRFADDGKLYDWYIRISPGRNGAITEQQISSIPSQAAQSRSARFGFGIQRAAESSVPWSSPPSKDADFAVEKQKYALLVKTLAEQSQLRGQSIRDKEGEIGRLNVELKNASQALCEEQAKVQQLQGELNSHRQQTLDLQQQPQDLQSRVAAIENDRNDALTEIAGLEEQLKQHQTMYAEVEEANGKLEERAEDLESKLVASEQQRKRIEVKLQNKRDQVDQRLTRWFKTLFPQVEFLREPNEVIDGLEEEKFLLERLRQLNSGELEGKKIQNAGRFFEVHFSTGNNDAGRLYFRLHPSKSNVYEALVGDKCEQDRDIERLRRFP